MVTTALGLSVDLWLTYLATVLLALRLHRKPWFSDRVVAALARRIRNTADRSRFAEIQ